MLFNRKHAATAVHREACVVDDRKAVKHQNLTITHHFATMYTASKGALLHRISTIYFLCYHMNSMSQYETLVAFLTSRGVKMAIDVATTSGTREIKYHDRTFVRQILATMHHILHQDILAAIRASLAYAIIVDESTDNARVCQMIIYYKFFDMEINKVRQVFGGIKNLKNGTANHLVEVMQQALLDDKLSVDQCGAIGCDGASTMLGSINGFGTQFKELNDLIVLLHCVCHRGALAAKDSIASIPYLSTVFFPDLEAVGKMYFCSGVKMASLLEEQRNIGIDNPVKLGKAAFTRWLSLAYLAANMLKQFPALLNDLRKRG